MNGASNSAEALQHRVTRRSFRIVRWVLIALGALVVFYAAIGFTVVSFLIGDHARWRGMNRGPRDFGLAGEAVSLRSLDGVPLRAWWMPARSPARGSVVIAHGIEHTRQVMLPRAAFLVRAGYNVLALDLRGHGESGGDVVSPGYLEANDVLAAERFARQRDPRVRIAVLGVSYGGAAALFAAARSTGFAAVVTDGAFSRGRSVYGHIVTHCIGDPRARWWLRTACTVAAAPGIVRAISWAYYARTGVNLGKDFPSVIAAAPHVRAPVLLISGADDWMAPPADAQELQAAFTDARTTLVVIPHGKHDTAYSAAPSVYEAAVLSFLDRVLSIQ